MNQHKNQIDLSVVVPVYNEEENVAVLHKEMFQVLEKLGQTFEILFVDDNSTDGTLDALKNLRPVKIIKLRKNSGQSSALDAGIKNANGKMIITLDGDAQNDPNEIPMLFDKLNEGYDVVCGWRFKRSDPFMKRFISKGAALLRKYLVDDGIHDAGCTLRIYKRICFEELELYGEMHRMIPALLKWRGFKIAEVKVNHRPRMKGKTKYNILRIPKGFMDMIYIWFWRKYSFRPLHLFGAIGIFFVTVGTFLLSLMAYLRVFNSYPLSDKVWPLVGFFSVAIGLQFFVSGLIAANIVEVGKTKKYYIQDIITREVE